MGRDIIISCKQQRRASDIFEWTSFPFSCCQIVSVVFLPWEGRDVILHSDSGWSHGSGSHVAISGQSRLLTSDTLRHCTQMSVGALGGLYWPPLVDVSSLWWALWLSLGWPALSSWVTAGSLVSWLASREWLTQSYGDPSPRQPASELPGPGPGPGGQWGQWGQWGPSPAPELSARWQLRHVQARPDNPGPASGQRGHGGRVIWRRL